MTSKKIILISFAFIFTILFTILGCCIFFRQNNRKTLVAQECPKIKNLNVKPTEKSETKPTEENLSTEPTEEWNTYYDERYKYRIDFPSGFSALSIYEHTLADGVPTTNGGIVFSPADSIDAPGGISVEIFENSKFQSLDEWLESEKSEYTSRVVEKKINIDGNETIVTHQAGMEDGKISEEYKQPKTIVFIKEDKLFVISASMDDSENEKLWNSFKFITGRYPVY